MWWPPHPGSGPVYTVLLTAKGKYLHDLFAYSIPGGALQQAAALLCWSREHDGCAQVTVNST